MSPEILIQLARIHGVSVDYLLGLTDVKSPYLLDKGPFGYCFKNQQFQPFLGMGTHHGYWSCLLNT